MSQSHQELHPPQDPMRLCYVCRMPISALAIKCRFCGADVGRPKKEQETFTVSDLGGEKIGNYTVSLSVREALESFMMEERAQLMAEERQRIEAERHTLKGRLLRLFGKDSLSAHLQHELESSYGDPGLASINGPISVYSPTHTPVKPRGQNFQRKFLAIGGIFILLVAIYAVMDYVWGWRKGGFYTSTTEVGSIYVNRARDILAKGGSVKDAYQEALIALKRNNSLENQEIAQEMRNKLIEDITAQAYGSPFIRNRLLQAFRDITEISKSDAAPEILHLAKTLSREIGYFNFILIKVDSDEKKAKFRLNNPFLTEKEQEVEVGDLLQGRFLVKSISAKQVVLEDTNPESQGREIISYPNMSL